MYNISLYYKGSSQPAEVQGVAAGQTLLEVALNNGIALRHDCGGACTCTTCHVFIEGGAQFIEPPSRREVDFLKKVQQRNVYSRLSCQCILQEGNGEVIVFIP